MFLKNVSSHPRDRLAGLIKRQGNTRQKIELDANILRFFFMKQIGKKERRLFLSKL